MTVDWPEARRLADALKRGDSVVTFEIEAMRAAEMLAISELRAEVSTAITIDAYEAINLLEALKVVPDTGDWHGQLRFKLHALLERDDLPNRVSGPNATAATQLQRLRQEADRG